MPIDRRSLIKSIGAVICAGAVPKFVPELVGVTSGFPLPGADPASRPWHFGDADAFEHLKQLYASDIVFQENLRKTVMDIIAV